MAFTKMNMACLALMVPGLMMADIAPPATSNCTAADVCTYSITASGFTNPGGVLTEDTSNTWNLTFTFLGPEMFNAAPNTLLGFTVAGTANGDWTYDPSASGLTSYGSDGAAIVTFDYTDGVAEFKPVTYTFFGTDAFWAATGDNVAFGATNDSTATSGAFFVGGGPDPNCTICTVSISATSAVPEPGSVALFATAVGIFLYFRRKQQKLAELKY